MKIQSTHFPAAVLMGLALACHALPSGAAEPAAHATVIPKETSASAVTQVDKKRVWTLSGRPVDVPAGEHEVEVYSCNTGSVGANACAARKYRLQYEAGKTYVFAAADLVKVFDGDLSGQPVDELRPWGNKGWLNRKDWAEAEEQYAQGKRAEQEALLAQRRADLPRTRKVGAKLCQQASKRITKVAYVEALGEDKVQLRVANASVRTSTAEVDANSPQVLIWDTPLNWDLCE